MRIISAVLLASAIASGAAAQRAERFAGSTRGILRSAGEGSYTANSAGAPAEPAQEESKEKGKEECLKAFNQCMDRKTDEIVMNYEVFFDDYSDMMSEIYTGVQAPTFRCIYDSRVKKLYSAYYFGINTLYPKKGIADRVRANSIEYYAFLKQNAVDVSSHKLPPTMLDAEAYTMADLKVRPKNRKMADYPEVSYKSTVLDPDAEFKQASKLCISPETNKGLEGCSKRTLEDEGAWGRAWKNMEPYTIDKSCSDYETFLIDKRAKSKAAAEQFITTLKTTLLSIIEQHNIKIEAEEEILDDMASPPAGDVGIIGGMLKSGDGTLKLGVGVVSK